MTNPQCNNVFSIFTGDEKTIYLKSVVGACEGDPLDLTACTEINISLPNEDGTFSHLLYTMSQVTIQSPAILGKFNASISSVISALLNIGEFQNFDVTFTIGGAPFTVRFYNCLSVFER